MMDDGWNGRRRAIAFALLSSVIQYPSTGIVCAGEPPREPSVAHGAGQVVRGTVFELPKAVLGGTLEGPPVVGTAMGLLGGTIRALQVTAAGLVEMAQGFHPFEEREP